MKIRGGVILMVERLQNDEPHGGVKGGGGPVRRPGPALLHSEAQKEGRLPRESEERGVSVGEEVLLGSFQAPLKLLRLVTRHWLQV